MSDPLEDFKKRPLTLGCDVPKWKDLEEQMVRLIPEDHGERDTDRRAAVSLAEKAIEHDMMVILRFGETEINLQVVPKGDE